MVKPADTRLFEQAIFILRADAPVGQSEDRIMREACAVADQYLRRTDRRRRPVTLLCTLCAAAGAVLTGLIWLLSSL